MVTGTKISTCRSIPPSQHLPFQAVVTLLKDCMPSVKESTNHREQNSIRYLRNWRCMKTMYPNQYKDSTLRLFLLVNKEKRIRIGFWNNNLLFQSNLLHKISHNNAKIILNFWIFSEELNCTYGVYTNIMTESLNVHKYYFSLC